MMRIITLLLSSSWTIMVVLMLVQQTIGIGLVDEMNDDDRRRQKTGKDLDRILDDPAVFSKNYSVTNSTMSETSDFANRASVADKKVHSDLSKNYTWLEPSTPQWNLMSTGKNLTTYNVSTSASSSPPSSDHKNKSLYKTLETATTTEFAVNGTPTVNTWSSQLVTLRNSTPAAINTTTTTATLLGHNETLARYSKENETVIYSWTFFCHGITSPIEPYPNDRYSPSYWRFQLNWLTDKGQKQMYDLGEWIRKRYSKFCYNYHPRVVEILTEPSDRTFMSAECLLAGLFPFNRTRFKNGTFVFDNTRTWQPIPVHTVQSTMNLLASTESLDCRQYDNELDDVTDRVPWSTLPENYSSLIKCIVEQCGYNFMDISLIQLLQTVYNVYYDLRTEELAGLRLPKWTRNVYPEPIQTLAAKYLELFTSTKTLQRLKAGPTMGNIVNSMRRKIEGNLLENLKLYSGSQFSLTSIMNAFGVFNQEIPPFGSAFLIELSKSEEHFFVSIYFKNTSSSEPRRLSIPNCEYRCQFDKFYYLMQSKIPINWSEECNAIPIAVLTLSTPLLLAGLVVIIVLVFLTLLLLVKCCRCFKKENPE